MDPKKRRITAYIVGRLILNVEAKAVYDHDAKNWFHAMGTCRKDKIEVYDYERRCWWVAVIRTGRISIFDNGSKKFVELKLKGGKKFEGFDYESDKHFGGEVDPQAIALYDFQDRKYHHYVIADPTGQPIAKAPGQKGETKPGPSKQGPGKNGPAIGGGRKDPGGPR